MEKCIIVSNARHIKRNSILDDVLNIIFFQIWGMIITKTEENTTNSKQFTGILNFVIKIQDYKVPNRIMLPLPMFRP